MKRKQKPQSFTFGPFIKSLFISSSSCPHITQFIFLFMQMITFVLLVSSDSATPSQILQSFSAPLIIAFLCFCLIVRGLFKATTFRWMYVVAILSAMSLNWDLVPVLIASVLIFLNLVIEVLSHIQYEFQTQNIYSESFGHSNVLHFMAISICCYLRVTTIFGQNYLWIPQLIGMCLFTSLAIVKIVSSCANSLCKQFMIRFYILCSVYYYRNMIIFWVEPITDNYQHISVVFLSQLFYQIVDAKFGKFQVDAVISSGNITHLVFTIMSYQYNLQYDKVMEQAIIDLSAGKVGKSHFQQQKQKYFQEDTPAINPTISTIECQHKPRTNKFKFIHQILYINSENKRIGFECKQLLKGAIDEKIDNLQRCLFLVAQINFCVFNNLIMSKKMLQKLRKQCHSVSWVQRLQINKFQQKINQFVNKKYELNQPSLFQEFLENQEFRAEIVKHSYQYLSLWKYLQNPDFLFKKLSKLISKVLSRNKKIDALFTKLQVKCSTTILLLIDYLYMVRRDIKKAMRVWRDFQIYQQSHHLLQVQNKIYVCISLQQNFLFFHSISSNVKKLLGFDRLQVGNSPISALIPTFFAQAHQKMITHEIKQSNQGLFLMRKSTIIKHAQGYYVPINLMLKMVYMPDGALMMQGYVEVITNQQYNWPNYFFTKTDQGQVVEAGYILKDLIDLGSRRSVHIDEYFQDEPISNDNTLNNSWMTTLSNRNKKIKYLYINQTEYQYEMYRELNGPGYRASYYVCKNNQIDSNEGANINNSNLYKKGELKSSSMKNSMCFNKYPIKYQDFQTNLQEYFYNKQAYLKNISSKRPCVLFAIAILIFIIIFVLQFVLIGRIEVTREQNDQIKTDMSNLIQFYHSLQQIAMIINRYSIKVNMGLNYSYLYYSSPSLIMSLQQMNSKLQKYDIYSYGDSSSSNVLSAVQPLHQIVADMIGVFYDSMYMVSSSITLLANYNAHLLLQYIFGDGIDDYLSVFRSKIVAFNNQDSRIRIGIAVSVVFLSVLIYFLVIKIDLYKRNCEYDALDLLSKVNAVVIFSNTISQFLRRTVGGVNQKQIQKDNHFQKVKNQETTIMNKNQLTSNISARENSVRNFFEEQVLSSTNRQQRIINQTNTAPLNTLQIKQKVEQDENVRREQKIRTISKRFIILWTFVILIAVVVCAGCVITIQTGNQISFPKSVLSLLTILNRQIIFSAEVITYLDMISFNMSDSLYVLNQQKYAQVQNVQTSFDETQYPQFANFTQMLQKVTYVYLCEYMTCSSTYKDEINIIYYSAIHKINKFLSSNTDGDALRNMTTDAQTMFYAYYLLQKTIYDLLNAYLIDYTKFQTQRSVIFYAFYYSEVAVLVVCLIITIFLYAGVFLKEKKKYIDIVNLIKSQSYQLSQSITED